MDNKRRFVPFSREERLVLYNALCAYRKSCAETDERALRMGISPCREYDVVERLWEELCHEGMYPDRN